MSLWKMVLWKRKCVKFHYISLHITFFRKSTMLQLNWISYLSAIFVDLMVIHLHYVCSKTIYMIFSVSTQILFRKQNDLGKEAEGV